MLYPSIDSLLNKVHSKYLLVTVASKRARELQDIHDYKLDKYVAHKNVGKSLEEINAGYLATEEVDEDMYADEPAVNQEMETENE
ncbi:DNA-directed RNA polymerase subunit omega [Caldibacillus lycopersici]|uniref:DNA-directed RNA polymerase subunit omega n=1 Tax=Perspicuibacillus lycopersici TaxID=1325689 RepID=A0AAE3LLY8_9BACI|nr:DNA-directed RNA polymerase subunit omega [Perspicuibacillus lycopersici]MCU9612162.1 DNA-directed RNA polymerase subunit omega [Perspicuibacillus lycopersici]